MTTKILKGVLFFTLFSLALAVKAAGDGKDREEELEEAKKLPYNSCIIIAGEIFEEKYEAVQASKQARKHCKK